MHSFRKRPPVPKLARRAPRPWDPPETEFPALVPINALDALDQEIARVRREREGAIDRHDFDVSVTLRGQEKLHRVCGAEPP
jgi:hypothetical protein